MPPHGVKENNMITAEKTNSPQVQNDCVIHQDIDAMGSIITTTYHVFPGIDLIYKDVHGKKNSAKPSAGKNVFEISHCREGRMECEFESEFCYLAQGDMAIGRGDAFGLDSYYPGGHYHGVSVVIDTSCAPECLSCFLDDVNVRPQALAEKFCSASQYFVVRANSCLEHIFSEIYHVPDSIKKGYFKVKVLELLLFLTGMDIEKDCSPETFYTKMQVLIAKKVCGYLIENMDKHITISELSQIFHVSQTQLKLSFKGVYGASIYTYIRAQKMQAAARMLKQTNDTILDIAGQCGYDNGSKFAKAFRDAIGMLPNEYRSAYMER
ncbi:MAG: AraC family transcriptional regulator [Clostridia bacterium]|nr:AraC family transcriptional regulator [Clostridia bacterium]